MNNVRSLQSVNHRNQFEYESLQEQILKEVKVNCRVTVKDKEISIRTKNWSDYYLAKSVIRQRTSKEIVRDREVLGGQEA